MSMTLLSLFTVQVFLPLLFVSWLWGSSQPSRANWIAQALAAGGVVAFTLTVGALYWTSVYIGALQFVLFLGALAHSFRRLPKNWGPFRFGGSWKEKVFTGTQVLVGLLFVPLCVYALSGCAATEEPLPLRFPLEDGVYHVSHGGSNALINYHNVDQRQRYALDITKLNAFGTRATGVYPGQLSRYAIYGDTLYSPCRGTVREAVSGLPEYPPPKRGHGHPAGNRVVIECRGTHVHLAHMMPVSVAVDSGSVVAAGIPIGRVGNSGNTSEPHLHIHATREGIGVPVTFGGRFLVRNNLVWMR